MKNETYLTALGIILVILLIVTNVYWIWLKGGLAPKSEQIKVRFAYQFGFHYGTQIIMDHFDLVEKHSNYTAKATYQKISGGTTILEAIVAGSLEFASMGIAPAIKGVDQGVGTKIFASMGSKEHELWTWRDDILTVADLKEGDLVNVVKIGSIEHVGLIKAFADLGRTKEDVDAISVYFSHADALTMMETGEIDCAFTGAPFTTIYANNPERYHKVTNDTEIWGTPLPGSAFIAKVDFSEEHPAIAAAVLSAWLEATNWIINNQEEASHIIGAVYEYEPDEAWELWQESNLIWNPTYGLTAVKEIADIMYDLDLISKQLTEEELMFPWTRGMVGI